MLMLLCSPSVLDGTGEVNPTLVAALIQAAESGHLVGLVSNHPKPVWFGQFFDGSKVAFAQVRGRQSGAFIQSLAGQYSLRPYDVLALAANDTDVHMGKNAGALLLAAGWANSDLVNRLGIRVEDAGQFEEVLGLVTAWPGQWWYAGDTPSLAIHALADLSTYGKSVDQQVFAQKLTATVKHGGSRLQALLSITARSLLMDGVGAQKDLLWGVYPSSNSTNLDEEILSEFTHRLRTTVSRVRFAKPGEPLFIRHWPSQKRSSGGAVNRADPSEQLQTVHLNPVYQRTLAGRHVIVLDDCVTYGVSFAVASGLLIKAGAAKVSGIALGKFGNKLNQYAISINSDPFQAVPAGKFSWSHHGPFPGSSHGSVQTSLQALVP
jgi:hypothetical protein